MRYKELSWKKFSVLADTLAENIIDSGKKYDLIISINRGGLIGGVVLSHKLKLNHGVFTAKSYDGIEKKQLKKDMYVSMLGNIKSHSNILIFDDIADCGETLQESVKQIKKIDSDAKNVDTATIFYKQKSVITPTYYSKKITNDVWINFPWENNREVKEPRNE